MVQLRAGQSSAASVMMTGRARRKYSAWNCAGDRAEADTRGISWDWQQDTAMLAPLLLTDCELVLVMSGV